MANRPVFIPRLSSLQLVEEVSVEFKWHAGMAASQKQKSVDELHHSARAALGLAGILEVSTKSKESLGRALSAFNLEMQGCEGGQISVEVTYQASKVFEMGGPFIDLLDRNSYEAKSDERLKNSGQLLHFSNRGDFWPLQPPTAFYDWLYISALVSNTALSNAVKEWDAFTDIEFNPKRSLNCQARSVALFCSLNKRGLLVDALKSPDGFRTTVYGTSFKNGQTQLF